MEITHGVVDHLAKRPTHCRAWTVLAEAWCVLRMVLPGMVAVGRCPVSPFPGAAITAGCLKTTDTYLLPVLEARCPKSKRWQGWAASEGPGGESSLASCSSGGCVRSLMGSLTPVSASVVPLLPPLLCVFSSVCPGLISLCLSTVRVCGIAF